MAGEKKEVKIYNTDDDLEEGIAKHTAELSRKFSHQRGAFTVVLSGGYLIESLRKLVEPPYVGEVDWAKWHIFWVDERVVKKNDPDSNYLLAKEGFLSKVPIPEDQIYAINDTVDAEDAAADYEKKLKELVKRKVIDISPQTNFPRFDLMLLGMGPDGHLASLFPHHPLLKERKKWITFIEDSPKPPPVRITFTFPVIDASANIFMVVAGTGEVDAVQQALGGNSSTDHLLPVQLVKLENGKFIWFLDKLAASLTMAGVKEVKIYNPDDDLAEGIAKNTAELSRKFSHQRGAFTVVLSGGYLIEKLRKLVEPPYLGEVDWAKWHIFWVDERVVKKTDPDSNYLLAKDGFLSKVPIPKDQIYATNDTLDAKHAAADYEKRLKELVKRKVIDISPQTNFPRFDLQLLGMGPDGHLASLFPHHPLLKESKKWVTFLEDSPKPPPVRITFTFPVIDASAYIFMVVAGTGEVDAVKQVLKGNSSTVDKLPAQMVENGQYIWFLDKLAASNLFDKWSRSF